MTTKTDTEIRRAYTVLDYIEAHPHLHDQNGWVRTPHTFHPDPTSPVDRAYAETHCGTVACYAGWTALLNGDTVIYGAQVILDGGRKRTVEWRAADLLGLADDEIDRLFYQAGDIDELRDAVARIFGPRPADMPTPVIPAVMA